MLLIDLCTSISHEIYCIGKKIYTTMTELEDILVFVQVVESFCIILSFVWDWRKH